MIQGKRGTAPHMTTVIIVAAVLIAVVAGLAFWARSSLATLMEGIERDGGPVDLDDGQVNVLELGIAGPNAPPVVLIHGGGTNLKDMRVSLGDRLARDTRVILFDRPGHGWSDRLKRKDIHTPEGQAVALNAVLTKLGVQRPILVGHSWGGALALSYALSYPEDTAGIVAIAPVSHPWPGGVSWVYRLGAMPFIGWLVSHLLVPNVGALLIGRSLRRSFAPQDVPEDYAQSVGLSLVLRPKTFRDNARDIVQLDRYLADQSRYYGEISVPVVVVAGDEDRVVSNEVHAERLAAEIDRARLVMLNEVGHMPHHSSPNVITFEINRLAESLWGQSTPA